MVIQDNWEKPRWRFRETSIYMVKLAHPYTMLDILLIYSGWWFGTFLICPIILGMSSSQLTHIFRGRYTTNQYWYTLFWMVNNHKYPSIPSVNAWGSHLPSRSSMPRGARPPVTWWTHGDDMTGRCCVKIEHLIIPVFLLELPPIGAHPPFFHKPSYEEPFFFRK